MKTKDIEAILQRFVAPCKYGITSSDISLAAQEIAMQQDKMPSEEVDELEEYVRLLKIDADKLPKDKHDLLQKGKQEAYSHCWFTFNRMLEKFRNRMEGDK